MGINTNFNIYVGENQCICDVTINWYNDVVLLGINN